MCSPRSIGLRFTHAKTWCCESWTDQQSVFRARFPTETASGGIRRHSILRLGSQGITASRSLSSFRFGNFLFKTTDRNAHGNGYADPNIIIPEW